MWCCQSVPVILVVVWNWICLESCLENFRLRFCRIAEAQTEGMGGLVRVYCYYWTRGLLVAAGGDRPWSKELAVHYSSQQQHHVARMRMMLLLLLTMMVAVEFARKTMKRILPSNDSVKVSLLDHDDERPCSVCCCCSGGQAVAKATVCSTRLWPFRCRQTAGFESQRSWSFDRLSIREPVSLAFCFYNNGQWEAATRNECALRRWC
mmetsp:Transcript_22569/g.62735  ORF Transcript_22569/g.62735 Transcript_22569/m.62735 type:complete len:207 (-) Transcript_22569:8-628(-)